MILLIDIGNTSTVCSIYKSNSYQAIKRIECEEDIHSTLINYKSYKVEAIALCSVVPNMTNKFIEEIKKIFHIKPFIVSYRNANIILKVDSNNEVGADRICNAKAAGKFTNNNCIVVDFGTATTYDVINKEKQFIGGAIAPGIDISANYLIKKAALLKNTVLELPKNIIGKNTKTNIQSGVMYSAIFAIEGMIQNIIKEINAETDVILTGGFSKIISPKLAFPHFLNPNLTLNGIQIIYRENQ